MAVNVPGVPQDALVPFTYVAIDPSRGGGATPRSARCSLVSGSVLAWLPLRFRRLLAMP